MSYLRLAATGLLFLTLNAAPTYAASAEGSGARSCANFIEDYKNSPYSMETIYFSWAQGFMSGINIARMDDDSSAFRSMSFDEQREYLKQFCEMHQTMKFAVAVANLYRVLHQSSNSNAP